MLSNNKLKYLRSLQQRKFRQKYHNFIAEGEKITKEVLVNFPAMIEVVCAESEWLSENQHLLGNLDAEILEVSQLELKKISLLSTPNRVFLILRQPADDYEASVIENDFSLYLDDIRDPGNLGTILRIADWFGIRHVFRSENSVEAFNPKVIQASMGAFLRVKSPQVNLTALINELPKLPIYGAELGGSSVFEMDLPKAAILVIGNESRGIGAEISSQVTHKVAIPRHGEGGAESLNAAVATGIFCAAFRNA